MGEGTAAMAVVGDEYCDHSMDRQLTVHKTCLFYPGDGFAVYERRQVGDGDGDEDDKAGELVFRVENYGSSPTILHQRRAATDHVVLMGPQGQCILTVRRKRPSLHRRWEGFLCSGGGRGSDDDCNVVRPKEKDQLLHQYHHQHPLFSIRRSSIIRRLGGGGGDTFLVEVHPQPNDNSHHAQPMEFYVEGSFPNRCCTIYEGRCGGCNGGGTEASESVMVAEITRKVDASTRVVLGKDVFSLHLRRGFDAAFAMGLVLALDQITNNGEDEEEQEEVEDGAS